jgi:hypothetical protein
MAQAPPLPPVEVPADVEPPVAAPLPPVEVPTDVELPVAPPLPQTPELQVSLRQQAALPAQTPPDSMQAQRPCVPPVGLTLVGMPWQLPEQQSPLPEQARPPSTQPPALPPLLVPALPPFEPEPLVVVPVPKPPLLKPEPPVVLDSPLEPRHPKHIDSTSINAQPERFTMGGGSPAPLRQSIERSRR